MAESDWNFDYPKIAKESGFKFQQYCDGVIDWRQIGGIEVEKILQKQNIEKLDHIINHLAEVPLSPLLNSNILESGIAKYFLLSQLAIQYLIFCKRFLDETVTSLRITLKDLQSDNIHLKQIEQGHSNDILQLHKELQKLRNISEVVYPCSMCTKNFISNEMLNIHISRKHSNEMQQRQAANIYCNNDKRTEKVNDQNLISTIKLELEIKRLKERLNDAENIIKGYSFEISRDNDDLINSSARGDYQLSAKGIQLQNERKTLGTQVPVQDDNISTKNIGIQNNLIENKEKDEQDVMERNNILDIFKQITEKINQIEKVRDDDLKNREESLKKFESKLQTVTESLEAKQQHNLDILHKFTDKMSSQTSLNQDVNFDELKEFIGNVMEKIQNENKKQLHEMVEKFDQNYIEKLNSLNMKLEKLNNKSSSMINLKKSSNHATVDINNENEDLLKFDNLKNKSLTSLLKTSDLIKKTDNKNKELINRKKSTDSIKANRKGNNEQKSELGNLNDVILEQKKEAYNESKDILKSDKTKEINVETRKKSPKYIKESYNDNKEITSSGNSYDNNNLKNIKKSSKYPKENYDKISELTDENENNQSDNIVEYNSEQLKFKYDDEPLKYESGDFGLKYVVPRINIDKKYESSESDISKSSEDINDEALPSQSDLDACSEVDILQVNNISNKLPIKENKDLSKKLSLRELKSRSSTVIVKSKNDKFKESTDSVQSRLKLVRHSESVPKIVKKMQENRLRSVGISPYAKFLATESLPQITSDLSNIRRNKKKLFPKFSMTRNQLKTIVDNIARTKHMKIKSNSSQLLRLSSAQSIDKGSDRMLLGKLSTSGDDIKNTNQENYTSSASTKSDETDKEIEISENESENIEKEVKDTEIDLNPELKIEDFKAKLERILSSPIHKLKKDSSNIDNFEIKVPVPTPRKKVMFDFPMNSPSGYNSSINIDEEAKGIGVKKIFDN